MSKIKDNDLLVFKFIPTKSRKIKIRVVSITRLKPSLVDILEYV